MERKAEAIDTTSTGPKDLSVAIRRPNDVWVLPAARMKQILRGTFLESPAAPIAIR